VLLREGFAYVFRLEGADAAGLAKVTQVKVATGRREGERIEIVTTGGIDARAAVVTSGVGFLADGDTVRVVATAPDKAP